VGEGVGGGRVGGCEGAELVLLVLATLRPAGGRRHQTDRPIAAGDQRNDPLPRVPRIADDDLGAQPAQIIPADRVRVDHVLHEQAGGCDDHSLPQEADDPHHKRRLHKRDHDGTEDCAPRWTARDRARAELTREIKDVARRHVAQTGAADLSFRAVARELGIASSALYRYFPSRDALLTALIIDAYDALGACADTAVATAKERDFPAQWRAACHAVRRWALANPHEYALVYGSPVPGYAAPQDTVAAGSRVVFLLLGIVRDAWAAGALAVPPEDPPLTAAMLEQSSHLAAATDLEELPAAVVLRATAAWTQLFGIINLELFGQIKGAFSDNTPFFVHSTDLMARGIGLRPRS